MNVEIDLNQLVDNSISVVIVLLWFFVGMRLLYGYWPWQQGPKRRHLRPGKPKPHRPRPIRRIRLLSQRRSPTPKSGSRNQTAHRCLRSHCRPTAARQGILLIAR
jgi:hypothetical protein